MHVNQSSFIAPPTRIAHTIALLLHDYCAIYEPPPTPRLHAIHHKMLVIAISCKGQGALAGVVPAAPWSVLGFWPIYNVYKIVRFITSTKFLCTNESSPAFLAHPHLHCPHYCGTIARDCCAINNIRPPPPPTTLSRQAARGQAGLTRAQPYNLPLESQVGVFPLGHHQR